MNIPNFENIKFVDSRGYLTEEWQLILQQLFQALQGNLSDEGFKVPQQPTTVINQLNTAASKGALLYDSTTNQLKVNISGTFQVII
ncbi:MAG: hypothetical protein PHV62_08080 [Sulfuricurvum sp.]|nr:hypothetical protein [Sulfuricurvum sp.]